MIFRQMLNEKLGEWGASVVGFSKVTDYLPESLAQLQYAVTIGVKLSDFTVDQISDKPTYTYFHHYRTINSLIDSITLRTVLLIEQQGFNALAVPASQTVNDLEDAYAGIFPHKTAAVCAGLGWVGRSGLFISEKFGPRIRLGTVLTDMKISVDNHIMESQCGDCRACVQSCPAMAITGKTWTPGCDRSEIVDAKCCSDYMNNNFKHIGRGSVCGICMKVCPVGKSKVV